MKIYQSAFLFILLFVSTYVLGTHIRAADFSSVRISTGIYRVTLSVYTDYETVDAGIGAIPLDAVVGQVSTNNGAVTLINEMDLTGTDVVTTLVANETLEHTFEFTYVFSGAAPGAVYKLGFFGSNRNGGIKNIAVAGGSSSDEAIYIEELFFDDPASPTNASPEFTLPPIFKGATNRVYTYNPGGVDPDGDSLSYELIVPMGTFGADVSGYVFPDDPEFGAGSTFSIDPFTGQVTWDTPLIPGEYNVAIRINEFRDGVRIGYVIRDQQILIEDSDNEPPVLYLPQDTCIASGSGYEDVFFTNDLNRDLVTTDLAGILSVEGATLSTDRIRSDSTVNTITWSPDCDAIQAFPHYGLATATDDYPGFPLSTSGTWEIIVSGEAPNLLSVIPNNEGIQLDWSSYACQNPRAMIEIYRFECDTSGIERSACNIGVPDEWGAVKIGEVAVSETTFLDDGSVGGLSSGITYYYMISVQFGSPGFGESYASNVLSSNFALNLPLISEASYVKEHQDTLVTISWTHVLPFDSVTFNKPFTYSFISEGTSIASVTLPNATEGQVIIDTNDFNTLAEITLLITDVDNDTVGVQNGLRFERLTAEGTDEALDLEWTTNNTWIYPDSLYSKIYVFKVGEDTSLVDSVKDNIFEYRVENLTNGDSVCAYVELPYTYCVDGLDTIFSLFTNTSCSKIQDLEPPCPPLLGIDLVNCDEPETGNQLRWTLQNGADCSNDDIAFYTLYVATESGISIFDSLVEVSTDSLSFFDVDGEQLFCYQITATDSSGNVSGLSNIVCQDFCGEIIFPNIFTPNGDGFNDEFLPISSLDGLMSSQLSVFNRWGTQIFFGEDVIDSPWIGENSDGNPVSDGVYYVEFKALKIAGSNEEITYKGWVQVVR